MYLKGVIMENATLNLPYSGYFSSKETEKAIAK
jgi:hypothetical protein